MGAAPTSAPRCCAAPLFSACPSWVVFRTDASSRVAPLVCALCAESAASWPRRRNCSLLSLFSPHVSRVAPRPASAAGEAHVAVSRHYDAGVVALVAALSPRVGRAAPRSASAAGEAHVAVSRHYDAGVAALVAALSRPALKRVLRRWCARCLPFHFARGSFARSSTLALGSWHLACGPRLLALGVRASRCTCERSRSVHTKGVHMFRVSVR